MANNLGFEPVNMLTKAERKYLVQELNKWLMRNVHEGMLPFIAKKDVKRALGTQCNCYAPYCRMGNLVGRKLGIYNEEKEHMGKSLGEYIRLIPREDQDTMCGALTLSRPGFHRGILAFVPIEEIKQALRPKAPNYGYTGGQSSHQATQQNQYPPYPVQSTTNTGPMTGVWVTTLGGGGGVGVSPTTPYNVIPGSYTSGQTYTGEVPQTYLFAYAALLAAVNVMPDALADRTQAEEAQPEACEA